VDAVSLTLLALLLLLLALACIYLSLRNQRGLAAPLGKLWRYAGCGGLLASLWLMAAQGVVALFAWLTTLMVLLVLVPALAFWLRNSLRSARRVK